MHDNLTGFGLDLPEVFFTLEAFRVDFVDIFGSGRPGGKPAVFGDDHGSSLFINGGSSLAMDNLAGMSAIEPKIGSIDIAISPQQVTIGSLLAHVRRGDVVKVHSLRRGAAEAIEAVAHGERGHEHRVTDEEES